MANEAQPNAPQLSRLRWAYERARLRRAALWLAPLVVFMVWACASAWQPIRLVIAIALGLVTLFALWRGQKIGLLVVSAWVVGLVPFALARSGMQAAHACSAGSAGACSTICIASCTLGGLIAGFFLTRWVHATKAGWAVWLLGAGVILLLGALGCQPMSLASMLGMAFGIAFMRLTSVFAR